MTKRREIEDPWNLLSDLKRQVKLMQQTTKPHALSVHRFVGARLRLTAAQTFASSTSISQVLFNLADYDTEGFFDSTNNRIVIPSGVGLAGYYYIFAQVAWVSNATGVRRARIRVNNTAMSDGLVGATSGVTATTHHTMIDHQLSEGDTVDLAVYQNSGGNLDLQVAEATRLMIRFAGV